MAPDSELLRQYVQDGSEAAFAELVRRYVNLVYSVALRQAAGDTGLAQDVTQVVFVDLARKARVLAGRETLAGWLHTSARFAAGKAIRGEQRRRAREQEAVIMNENPVALEINWEQLRPVLDEGVAQLKETDRDALVLRFFQGKSHEEIGAALGLSENSANKRIERALEKLRTYFNRRGIAATAAIIAEVISANSVQAAPAELAGKATQAALASAAVGTAGSAWLFFLLMSTKTKIILGTMAIVAVVATLTINLQSATDAGATKIDQPMASGLHSSTQPAQVVRSATAAVASSGLPLPAPSAPTTEAAPVVAAAPATPNAAQPQAELKTAITVGLHCLEDKDLVGFFKTLMPPDALAREGRVSSVEEFAQLALSQPGMEQKIMQMQEVLNAVQAAEPSLNSDGTRATYLFDPPVASHKAVIFNKINGFWYLNGI